MRRIAWARHTKIKRWVITTSNHWWIILKLSHLYSYLEKLIKWAKIEIGTKIEATKIELKLRRAYPQNLRKWIEIERLLNLRKHGCADRRFCVRSRPVRLTHLDRLSFNMFLTHFCFRQLSPLVRDLNNTCYPFLKLQVDLYRYSGLKGLRPVATTVGPSKEYKSLKWKDYEIKYVIVIKIVRAD